MDDEHSDEDRSTSFAFHHSIGSSFRKPIFSDEESIVNNHSFSSLLLRASPTMNLNERSLATAAMLNAQGSAAVSNQAQENVEPSSTLSIFSADYKK